MMPTIRELFKTHRLCAILRNVPDSQVLNYAEAAYAGGIRLFEVAMNTETGDRQIRKLRDAFAGREVYIGAGTVIDEDRCLRAADAGAQFFLTPSAARSIMEYCRETGMPILPGVFTATDVGICLEYGYDTMKLFPAGDMPLGYVKSLKGPFDGTDYVAVGGLNLENIKDFLAAGYIGAGIGSNLIPKTMIAEGKWKDAEARVRAFVRAAGLGKME